MTVAAFFLRGQGGWFTSLGIDHMAKEVEGWPDISIVHAYNWDDWQSALSDINASSAELLLACGFSLGANALTWIIGGLPQYHILPTVRIIDSAAFIDPTTLSIVAPMSREHCRSALHFHNNSFEPWGHGTLTFDGRMDRVELHNSHFLLDVLPSVHSKILGEWRRLIDGIA